MFIATAFQLPFECANRKVQVYHEVLELNGTHQFLVYADAVHIFGENKYHKNRGASLKDNKEVNFEIQAEKNQVYGHDSTPKCRTTHNLLIASKSLGDTE
jgi:hypothetical protein